MASRCLKAARHTAIGVGPLLFALACQPASVPRDVGDSWADAGPTDAALGRDAAADGARSDLSPAADVSQADASPPRDSAGPDLALPDRAGPDLAIPDRAPLDATPHVCPAGGALDCSPGSGTGEGAQCSDAPSCYYNQVRAAVNATINGNPGWFEHSDTYSCEIVLDVENYMNSVVAWLVGAGLCAIRDPNAPGEEITVKHDNAFSENFDILAATGCARSGAATYTGFCAPAWW